MSTFKNIIQNNEYIILFSVIFLTYISIRAYSLSFTHDESLSFTLVDGNNNWRGTANNHILNTILMSLSKTLFGTSEFSLRLPNVLSFLIYLMGSFFIFRTSKNKWLLFFGLSMILLNPFLIEFFSLARGYGLSLAFMLMSIFFLIKKEMVFITPSKFLRDFIFTSFFASLAIYSNLTMINFFICVMIIFSFKYWLFRKKHNTKSNFSIKFWGIFFISCIPLWLGIKRLLKLKGANQLYFGSSNFIEGFDSLIISSNSFEEYASWVIYTVKVVVVLSLSIGILHIILKKKYSGVLFLTIMLIALLIFGFFLENLIFGAKYPTSRTALFYIPIIAIFIYHLFLDFIQEYKIKKQYWTPVVFCLVTPLLINFAAGANITYTTTWRYDAHTKDVMRTIRDYTQNVDYNASISNHWLFEPTINYYTNTWKLNLDPANRNGINLSSDFIYRLDKKTKLNNFKILNYYDDIKSDLLMKTETNRK